MYSLSGALGRSMDFVPLHHQFSGIGFYEPNPVQQEANIKMLACFLNQTSLSSCFRLPNCPHLLFLCQNLFPGLDLFLVSFHLDADGGTALHLRRRHPAFLSKAHLDSYFTDCAFAVLQDSFLLAVSCHNKKLNDITLNWVFSI